MLLLRTLAGAAQRKARLPTCKGRGWQKKVKGWRVWLRQWGLLVGLHGELRQAVTASVSWPCSCTQLIHHFSTFFSRVAKEVYAVTPKGIDTASPACSCLPPLPPDLHRLNISCSTAAMTSWGWGLSTYTAPTAASAADGQLGATEGAGGPTSTLTAAASIAWCTSGGTGSAGMLLTLLVVAAEGVLWKTGVCVGTRWGAAWRRVMKVWRATQESCD